MSWLRKLIDDRRGITIVEFGLVAPVMCLLLMGAFDIGHSLYLRVALHGVMQKVSRDASLETGTEAERRTALDAQVSSMIRELVSNATITPDRRFYRSFTEADARRPEPFTDTDANGRCNGGEPFQDDNLNTVWDQDGGDAGQGGAEDAVVYTVVVSYPRVLPLWSMIGMSSQATVSATTVWRNQPYGDQDSYGESVVRNCP